MKIQNFQIGHCFWTRRYVHDSNETFTVLNWYLTKNAVTESCKIDYFNTQRLFVVETNTNSFRITRMIWSDQALSINLNFFTILCRRGIKMGFRYAHKIVVVYWIISLKLKKNGIVLCYQTIDWHSNESKESFWF